MGTLLSLQLGLGDGVVLSALMVKRSALTSLSLAPSAAGRARLGVDACQWFRQAGAANTVGAPFRACRD